MATLPEESRKMRLDASLEGPLAALLAPYDGPAGEAAQKAVLKFAASNFIGVHSEVLAGYRHAIEEAVEGVAV